MGLTKMMLSSFMLAAPINSFVTLSILRTAARRSARKARRASAIDASFTVAKKQAAIPDMRAKVDGNA
jgi:hypothetical protein